ncbi:hypothetical protein G9A89_010508 [Geosiphon pyriformis]|nr:hypothetical protein G9A89_010508 [Geosiphon pyriformis]
MEIFDNAGLTLTLCQLFFTALANKRRVIELKSIECMNWISLQERKYQNTKIKYSIHEAQRMKFCRIEGMHLTLDWGILRFKWTGVKQDNWILETIFEVEKFYLVDRVQNQSENGFRKRLNLEFSESERTLITSFIDQSSLLMPKFTIKTDCCQTESEEKFGISGLIRIELTSVYGIQAIVFLKNVDIKIHSDERSGQRTKILAHEFKKFVPKVKSEFKDSETKGSFLDVIVGFFTDENGGTFEILEEFDRKIQLTIANLDKEIGVETYSRQLKKSRVEEIDIIPKGLAVKIQVNSNDRDFQLQYEHLSPSTSTMIITSFDIPLTFAIQSCRRNLQKDQSLTTTQINNFLTRIPMNYLNAPNEIERSEFLQLVMEGDSIRIVEKADWLGYMKKSREKVKYSTGILKLAFLGAGLAMVTLWVILYFF